LLSGLNSPLAKFFPPISLQRQIDDLKELPARVEIAFPSSPLPGVLSFDRLLAEASPKDPEVVVGPDDLFMIGFSSGTTGRPKGFVYTVGQWQNRLRNDFFNQDIIIDHHDVLLSVAPLTHAAGVVARPYMMKAAKQIILEDYEVEETLQAIQREKVTAFFMVPTMLVRLVNHPMVREYDLSSVKRIYYSSAPMPVETLKKAIEIFGPKVFRQHYAVGEHPQPVCLLYPDDHVIDGDEEKERRLASVGRLCIGSELKVVDENGQAVGPNITGEIWIRGDASMREYWKDPELTAEAFVNGWFRTGDVGFLDEGGYLLLVDRMKDMIISGGFNIYPREVEQTLEAHPGVLEVCVFGIPEDEWGESIKACVVLKAGASLTEQEISDWCATRLARFKKPRHVEFMDELPKGPTGKILRRALRDPYWKGRPRNI
jgi:acyl-CoA synthetase (AMP-forming)/AMP-acid ligase II